MKKTALVVVGLLIVAAIVGFWLGKAPSDPVYEGKPLSQWLRAWGENPNADRPIAAMRALGSEAIPWLMWAAENGREPSSPDKLRMAAPSGPLEALANWLFRGESNEANHFDERGYALQALFLIGNDRADVDEFTKRLTADPRSGAAAAAFLARKGGEQAEYILRLSSEGSAAARLNSVNAFRAMQGNGIGEKTVPALVRALRDADPMVRAAAAIAYGNTSHLPARQKSYGEVLPILIGLLSDPAWQVRDGAAWVLFTMGRDASSAVPKALPLLADPEPFVRQRIARALGRIDKAEQHSRPALLKMANDPGDFGCRVAATEALGQFGVRAGLIDELIARLESTEATERGEAMCALVDIGPPAADSMPKILKAMEKEAGFPANYSLLIMNFDHFGAKEAVPNLILALSHPDPVVREYSALEFDSVLWDEKDPRIEPALTKATQDPEASVREAAEKALRRIRETR